MKTIFQFITERIKDAVYVLKVSLAAAIICSIASLILGIYVAAVVKTFQFGFHLIW